MHKWHVGDLVIWDNRRTLHRATPFPVDDAKCAAPPDGVDRKAKRPLCDVAGFEVASDQK